jgi:hypothetical protein
LQKRTEVQWDIGAALGADDGADESTSPQAGIKRYRLIAGRDDADVEELKDIAFNASVTAWHLSDWVFNDLTGEQRKKLGFKNLEELQEHARTSCRALHLCRYAATASKHWQVTRYPDPRVQTVVTAETSWCIYFLDNGRRIAADQVFEEAVHFWTQLIYPNEIAKDIEGGS